MLRIAQNAKKTSIFLVLGVPTFGEGEGGSTWLGQNPNFFQKSDLKAPLNTPSLLMCDTTNNKEGILGCCSNGNDDGDGDDW